MRQAHLVIGVAAAKARTSFRESTKRHPRECLGGQSTLNETWKSSFRLTHLAEHLVVRGLSPWTHHKAVDVDVRGPAGDPGDGVPHSFRRSAPASMRSPAFAAL